MWERARVGCFKRTASKHVYYLGWNRSPAQVVCMRQLPLFLSHPALIPVAYSIPAAWIDTVLETNTGPDREKASFCQTPCLLQVRTCLLSSQPCFLLPPHLSFSSSFSKGLGPLLSLHTPAQPAGPQGTAHPAPGTGSFPTSVKASSWHFHLVFPTLYGNSLNRDSAELSQASVLISST